MLITRRSWGVVATLVIAAATAQAGLIGYWNFDESGGNVAVDASGQGATGAIQGVPTRVAGARGGTALDFNGSNNQVSVASAASIFASVNTQATVAFWQFGAADQPLSRTIFSAKGSGGQRFLQSHLPWDNSNVYWDAGNSSGYDRINRGAAPSEFRGQWNHWAFVKNATTGVMEIHLNGALWHSGTGRTLTMAGVTQFAIGSEIGGNYYHGQMDEFAVWNQALTPTQILDLYNRGVTFSPTTMATSLVNSSGVLAPGGIGAIGTTTFAPQPTQTNIAPTGTASQISTAYGGVASRANDGNTDGNYWNNSVTHTAPGYANPWWEVDLGADRTFGEIALWNRTDGVPERLTNFRVSVLDATRTAVWGQDYFTGGGYPNPTLDILLPGDETGRYVRVQRYNDGSHGDGDVLSLAEVQILILTGTIGTDYAQGTNGILTLELDPLSHTCDRLSVSGQLTAGGTLDILSLSGSPALGDVYHVLDFGSLSGRFARVNLPALANGVWDLSQLYTTGDIAVLPEPATALLLAGGLAALVRRRKPRRA